jgi:hypothetical protein
VTICLRCVSQPQNEYPFAVTTLLLQSYYHQLSFQQLSGYKTCMTYLHHLLKASMTSSCRCHVHGSRVFFILCCVPEIDGVKHALGHSEPHLLVAPLFALVRCGQYAFQNKKTMKLIKCEICQKEKALPYLGYDGRSSVMYKPLCDECIIRQVKETSRSLRRLPN